MLCCLPNTGAILDAVGCHRVAERWRFSRANKITSDKEYQEYIRKYYSEERRLDSRVQLIANLKQKRTSLLQLLAHEDRKMTHDENKELNKLNSEVAEAVEEYRTQKMNLAVIKEGKDPSTNRRYRGRIRENFFVMEDIRRRRARRRGALPHMLGSRAQRCKGKGNCCARGCGCCAKPRADLGLQEADEMFSHCTEYSICCELFYKRLATNP